RHGARHGLSAHDHRAPDRAAAPVQALDAEGRLRRRKSHPNGVARLARLTLASKPTRRHPVAARAKRVLSRMLIYAALLSWTFICLFPIYWTVTTSFKSAIDVTQAHLIPWVDFQPDWKGWRSLGLSPDTLFGTSTARSEFVNRFVNSIITSVGASV